MRTRLLLVLLPLMALLLIALGTLFAQSYAARLSQERFAERLLDVESLADSAEATLRGEEGTRRLAALRRSYHDTHGSESFVFNSAPTIVGDARRDLGTHEEEILRARDAALSGQPPARPRTAWPWRSAPFVIGASAGRENRTVGAVVIVAPTGDVAREVGVLLLLLAVGGLAVLLLATVLGVLPLARWVLRPVGDLETAAERIAAGVPEARVTEDGGPPELRGLAAAFNRMSTEIAAALARQRAFAADASHQLRNPLTALRLRMDSLALHVAPGGERQLRAALDEADRLAERIDVLLRLARSEATEAELRVVDVVQTTRGRVDAWRPTFAEARIELAFSAPAPCHARCDATAVEEALDALLDNARKFGGASGVEVTVAPHGGAVRVRVRDRGPGLGAAERARAAERFWRSPHHQNVDGTGLGLTIARTLLEAGGGRLELHDARPGLAADILLPAPGPDGADRAAAQRPASS